jgi:Zn-dependent metalloprotease
VSHRDKSGKIKGVSWNGSHKVAVASTSPKIALAAATAAGDKKASLAQQTTGATKGELVVYSGSGSAKAMPKLAYDVLTAGVRADQTPSRLHTIVDANSGATLASWDEIQNGTGNSLYVGQVSIGTSGGPPWTMSDPVGNVTTDLRGDGDLTGIPDVPGTIFSNSVSDLWGNGSVSDRASAAVDAQYGAEKTFDYFKNVQGRNGIWDTGVGARSRVHYGTNYVNAFWDGAQMTYGDGFANAHPLVALDVAAHEMTHGVTENTAGLSYDGESIGLNEATSDIFGTAVEFYADNLSDPPDYTIGEKIDFNGSGPRALRYLDKPSKDGLSKDCWSSTLGSLDPHYSSGPLNHWFYLASEGSGVKTIRGLTYNSPTCNASTVTPIGRDKAAKIWYRTLTTYLTSSSTYASARDGAIQSAKDLYGVNSAECTNVAASFSAIDVPAGAVTCAGTPPSPSGGNLLSNPGFESGTVGWLGSAGPITSDPGRPAHSGSWKMWLGDNGTTATESERQAVTIPSTAIAPTLSYWIRTDTDETGSTVYDTMKVQVISGSTTNTLDTYSNVGTDPNYAKKTFDLSAYVGQTISVQFLMHEDVALQTSFVVDDTAITTAPAVPMGVVAQARNAAAAVSWTAPASNGGSAITGYTVTAAPGGRTATTNGATTATVTGLSNGTAYTFTVTATNAVGTSPASLASTAVTPSPSTTAPSPPVGVTATAGNSKAAVSWTAPASDGGSVVTGYTVTAAPGGRTATTTGATSATVTDLTNGTAYTFTVTATNAAGSSADSARSNSVTTTSVAAVTRLSDFNRDGSTDLVARDVAGRLWLYPGNGAGGFLGRRQMGVGWNTMASIVTPGDVTGDGVGDLVARDTVGRLWLYPGNGSSGLGARRQIGSGWSTMNAITAAGDLNGAGRPDLLARDLGGVLWLYPVSGNAAVGARIRIGAGWNGFTVLGAGDLSGDGRADVLARDPAGVLWLYQGNGAGGLTAQTRAGAGWAGMSALVTPGNWDRAAGNDTLARDATGHLWFYPGNNAGGLGARRLIGSGWNGYTLN